MKMEGCFLMKKHLIIVIIALLLVACGNNNNSEEKSDPKEVESEKKTTEEITAIMPSDSEYEVFIALESDYESYVFDIKERYVSEATNRNGVNELDVMRRDQVDKEDETFDYTFSLMLGENISDGEQYLLFAGNVVNNTKKRVHFNHDFEVIMRDMEDATSGNNEPVHEGIVDVFEPELSGEGWYAFHIQTEEVPKELEIKFERAWDEDGASESGADEEYLSIDFELE